MQMTVYVSNSCKRVNVPFYFSLIIPSNLCIFNLTSSDFYLCLRPFWHVSIIFLNLWEPWESSGRGGHFELSISRWPLLPMVSFKLFECLLRLLLFWSWYVKMHVDLKCLAANVLQLAGPYVWGLLCHGCFPLSSRQGRIIKIRIWIGPYKFSLDIAPSPTHFHPGLSQASWIELYLASTCRAMAYAIRFRLIFCPYLIELQNTSGGTGSTS